MILITIACGCVCSRGVCGLLVLKACYNYCSTTTNEPNWHSSLESPPTILFTNSCPIVLPFFMLNLKLQHPGCCNFEFTYKKTNIVDVVILSSTLFQKQTNIKNETTVGSNTGQLYAVCMI